MRQYHYARSARHDDKMTAPQRARLAQHHPMVPPHQSIHLFALYCREAAYAAAFRWPAAKRRAPAALRAAFGAACAAGAAKAWTS